MTRDDNCLPNRIKAVLALIHDGDFAAMAKAIADNDRCLFRDTCEVGNTCLRIHRAFLPLAPFA